MMVYAAYLTRNGGRYTCGEPSEEDADTPAEFIADTAPGITVQEAPEVVPLVDSLRGGTVFRVTDKNAVPDLEVSYLVVWEGEPAPTD